MVDQITRVIRRRRRPARSCIECRRRKIKCNRQMPCNHCTATRKHCVFSNVSTSRLIDTSSSQPNEPLITPPQADQVPAKPCGNVAPILENMRQDLPLEVNESSNNISHVSPVHGDRINELERRLGKLENLLSCREPKDGVGIPGAPSLAESGYASNPVLQGAKPILNKSRLFGRTHWTNDVPEVSVYTCIMAKPLKKYVVKTNQRIYEHRNKRSN